jgi:hypothetical protein
MSPTAKIIDAVPGRDPGTHVFLSKVKDVDRRVEPRQG